MGLKRYIDRKRIEVKLEGKAFYDVCVGRNISIHLGMGNRK
jgi:hypothetical protein